MGVKENLSFIKEQIGNNNVKIIAVTKYATSSQLLEAHSEGISDFGESYVQDALKKFEVLNFDISVKWHFIGRLQKNKVKFLIPNFYLIHSVDSTELASVINKKASENKITQNILLQVNIQEEPTKAGFKRKELVSSFEKLAELSSIKILGLMTIAPNTNEEKIIRECFQELAKLKEEINTNHRANLKELSMGMTNDYKIAIECGATMVRIGRAIFKTT